MRRHSPPLYSLVHGSPVATPSEGPQCHPTHIGGTCPKVPTKPSTAQCQSQSQLKGMPDPVNHPSQWILEEMDRAEALPH